MMRLASLFSGGKDSTFSIMRAREMGHEISCLISIDPVSDDSLLFHYPNSWVTDFLAESMRIPIVRSPAVGGSKEGEISSLEQAITRARSSHAFEGILHGGISSQFQRKAFEKICEDNGLAVVAPLWGADPVAYTGELLDSGFHVMIVGVSAMGLGREWLGRILDWTMLQELRMRSAKYGFNLNFEGGEAETLVVDCPLYEKRLQVMSAETHWDGQRGIFEIREVALVEKSDHVR
ncbi:MAG TPA: diphthine--ammonia ligase [Nitrososphaera sp.]|nr:diphthine--ammonia ligase [Nitrososphaera sp.]